MKTASVADVKAHLSAYLNAITEGPVVVNRNGKAVAVLVAVADEDELERLLMAHSPKLQAMLNAARQRIDEGKGIPHDQFWAQVEKENRPTKKRAAKGGKNGRTKRSA